MPDPRTTPNEHDVPVVDPGKPTPDDPRKEAPMRDPPVNPPHDGPNAPVRQANANEPEELGGVEAPEPSPDRIVYDESRVPG
jgi:hypothetical protein